MPVYKNYFNFIFISLLFEKGRWKGGGLMQEISQEF